jgi:hypothetical protein
MPDTRKDAAREEASRKRADYLRALEEELAGYVRHDRAERVKDVKAEIARVKKAAPSGRSTPDASTTA